MSNVELANLYKTAPSQSPVAEASYREIQLRKTTEYQPSAAEESAKGYLAVKPDYSSYKLDMDRRLRRAWLPTRHKYGEVKVTFRIHQDGHVSDIAIAKSTGDSELHQDALEAVERAAPFRPLPSGAPSSEAADFTFRTLKKERSLLSGGVHLVASLSFRYSTCQNID